MNVLDAQSWKYQYDPPHPCVFWLVSPQPNRSPDAAMRGLNWSQISAPGSYLLLASNYCSGHPLSTATKCFSLFIDYLSTGYTQRSCWLIIGHWSIPNVKITSMLSERRVTVSQISTQHQYVTHLFCSHQMGILHHSVYLIAKLILHNFD